MLQDRERHPNATVFHPCYLAFAGRVVEGGGDPNRWVSFFFAQTHKFIVSTRPDGPDQ